MATNNMQMQTFVTQPDDAEIEGFDGYNGDLTGSVAATLGVNCGMSTGRNGLIQPIAFAANQRDEVRDLHDVAGALGAQPGMKQQTFIAEGVVAKGNGDCFLTPERHTSLSAGGGQAGQGYQADLAYTLTATDHHAVFSRQRVDIFKDGEVTSTQSARQHKDATDLVLQGTDQPRLIRRLTPLECERLQGFPDGWTDIPNASDSSRYKALGNSVAIPCVDYVLFGIALVLLAG